MATAANPIRRVLAVTLVVLGFVGTGGGFREVVRRPAPALAPQIPAPPSRRVDRAALMQDVRALADPALGGRRTGTDGSRRARAYIVAALQRAGVQPLEGHFEHPFGFVHEGRPRGNRSRGSRTAYPDAANVEGLVPGRDGNLRWIVVSAHYDHLGTRDGVVYPGADDNASGVAVLLAAARLFSGDPARHPFVFVAFDAEELGLEGARHFVQSDHLTRARVAIDVNLDMVSRSAAREIFAAGTGPQPWLRPILERGQRRSAVTIRFGHDRPSKDGGLADWTHASDHGAFVDAGIAFLYFGVEDHPDYHRPTDTVDRIDPAFFGDVADVIADALRALDRALD